MARVYIAMLLMQFGVQSIKNAEHFFWGLTSLAKMMNVLR